MIDAGMIAKDTTLEHATFAMGCFWHTEEMFSELRGVTSSLPGYCGGTEPSPSYDLVSSGRTRYAESVEVMFDPRVISYEKLLEVFFREHDPTTRDAQGNDVGPQYRSVIFFHNAGQRLKAEAMIARLNASTYHGRITTELAPFTRFWRAEDYHLQYFRKHPNESYIAHVTRPEIERFRKDFPELLK